MSEEFDEHYWEEHYRAGGQGGAEGGHGGLDTAAMPPNPYLVAAAADLAPGRALDAGCGEGAEARWLAARGWRVRAVDISATALDRARERAQAGDAEAAQRIEWVCADVTARPPAAEAFDLVCSHYVHPAEGPDALVKALAAAVAPGGTLVIVGHDPADPKHADRADAYITPEQVGAGLDPEVWEITTAESRTRPVPGQHGGDHGHGHGTMLHDAVLAARKRA